MSSLSLSVLVCLSVCATVCWGNHDVKYGRHSISVGQRRLNQYPPDVLLYHDHPETEGKLGREQKIRLCYPPEGSSWQGTPGAGQAVITAFEVKDLVPEDKGGYVFVDDGGVDSDHLCLYLKSKTSQGYNFDINIWGYYAQPSQ